MDEFRDLEFDLSMPINEITNSDHRLRAIEKFAPNYEVKMAKDQQYKGFYRVGKMPNFEEKAEKYHELVQRFEVDKQDPDGDVGWLFWTLISPFILLFIALVIFAAAMIIPLVLIMLPLWVLSRAASILCYRMGLFPGRSLTVVDHLYVHPDGRVAVPVSGNFKPFDFEVSLKPFNFEVSERMELVTHYHDGAWESVSMVRGRRQYFQLTRTDPGRTHLNVYEVTTFLAGFGLNERTTTSMTGEG